MVADQASLTTKMTFSELKARTVARLERCNLPVDQAERVADCFSTADLYGVTSHGVSVLPAHISRIEQNGYNLHPRFSISRQSAAFAVIDGDNAMGPVAASYCMNLAIERSKETGIYTVFSFRNNTYGAAFYYPLIAARQGFIGATCCNTPALMAPIGGVERLLGTNPFAIAIPCGGNEPIVVDMATSVVAKSRINESMKKGESIPEGWALDALGCPTTNPSEALNGLVLPMAGFKGYGLAMMIDILSGVLSGASFLNTVGKFYSGTGACMNVGFVFTVIDPRQVYGVDFYQKMDEYVSNVRRSAAAEGRQVSLPGDDRLRHKASNMQNGIDVSERYFD